MYEWYQLGYFFLLYSFLGWCIETLIYTLTRRKFTNAGFLTLPFILTYGVVMVLLIGILPAFGDNLLGQFIFTFIQASVFDRLGNFNVRILTGVRWPDRGGLFGGTLKGFLGALVISAGYYLVYQIIHPLFLFFLPLFSGAVFRVASNIMLILLALDFIFSVIAVRMGKYEDWKEHSRSAKTAAKLTDHVWSRIQKTYPGIRDMNEEQERETYVFGQGMTFDKLIWVFFLSALLGDLIETLYCGFVDGEWMSRSSVLYGPFSFVWGIGAVVLTITLQPLAKKNDRWVFLGGFFVGGAYEYLCSVFTEMVFGTVFWDYSDMPLNINGRTNVLFMFFWGILSVVWVKIVYPRMSKWIENIPPLAGQVITWPLCVTMFLNGALTMMTMVRYNFRRIDPNTYSLYEEFLDYKNGA